MYISVIIVYFHGLSSFPVGTKINQPTANDKFVNGAETELKLQKISEKLELIEAVNPEGFPKLHDKELKRKRSFSEGEVLSKITKQIVAKETCDMMKLINETGNIENKIQIQVKFALLFCCHLYCFDPSLVFVRHPFNLYFLILSAFSIPFYTISCTFTIL